MECQEASRAVEETPIVRRKRKVSLCPQLVLLNSMIDPMPRAASAIRFCSQRSDKLGKIYSHGNKQANPETSPSNGPVVTN